MESEPRAKVLDRPDALAGPQVTLDQVTVDAVEKLEAAGIIATACCSLP